MNCLFDNGYECSILTSKKCDACKFRKTRTEFESEISRSNEILKRKHLVATKKKIDGILIMTTEDMTNEN